MEHLPESVSRLDVSLLEARIERAIMVANRSLLRCQVNPDTVSDEEKHLDCATQDFERLLHRKVRRIEHLVLETTNRRASTVASFYLLFWSESKYRCKIS